MHKMAVRNVRLSVCWEYQIKHLLVESNYKSAASALTPVLAIVYVVVFYFMHQNCMRR
jgi:hypothetical protein